MPRHEDDDDRPRRRSRPRDDEDDDRPSSRSRRPRDDDDDRPSSRSRRPRDDEDDERPSSRSRRSGDFDDEYRPRRKSRPKQKEQNVIGLVGLLIAIVSLFLSFIPCLGWYAIIPALVSLALGFVGLVVAQKSDGRQSTALPFAAMGVSILAVVIAVGWLLLFKGVEKKLEQIGAQAEAERKAELDRTSQDVKSATNPIRITAEQLDREYEQNFAAANARYEGKVLEVTGVVESVDFDELEDEYRVSLKTAGDDTVDCDFLKDPAIRARLQQLKTGTRVTIRGKCIGSTILEGCIIIS